MQPRSEDPAATLQGTISEVKTTHCNYYLAEENAMRLPTNLPSASGATSLNQTHNSTSENASTTAAPAPRSIRLPSEIAIVHANAQRESASFRRNLPPETFQNLPPETLRNIAAHLPAKDRITLAFTNKSMLWTLAPEADAAALTMLAPRVNTLTGFKNLLKKIQGLTASSLRKEPLTALMDRIHYLSIKEQQEAIDVFVPSAKNYPDVHADFIATTSAPKVDTLDGFNTLLPGIKELPASHQELPFKVLGVRIPHLPAEEQQEAIKTFFADAENYPEALGFLVIKLVAKTNTPAGINNVLPWIRSLPESLQEKPMMALSNVIRRLPANIQQEVIDADVFFANAENLPGVRAFFIATTLVPRANTLDTFNALSPEIHRLPVSLQGELLATWGVRIPHLPAEEQQEAIKVFLASAESFPEPRPALLDELIQAAADGPEGLAAREQAAIKQARAAVRGGETVQSVARQYGITNPETLLAVQGGTIGLRRLLRSGRLLP